MCVFVCFLYRARRKKQRQQALSCFVYRTDVSTGGVGINFTKMRGVGHVVFYDMPHNINIFMTLLKMTGRFQENGRPTTFFDQSVDMPVAPALRRPVSYTHLTLPTNREV